MRIRESQLFARKPLEDLPPWGAGVLMLRVMEPERPRPFKVPLVWVVAPLGMAACVFIMVSLPYQASDLGATVIKIEPPPGDPMRWTAWPQSPSPSSSSGIYNLLNAGKQIVTLDLRAATARDELHALLARAAVCVEGFKPATAREIGVDGATLAAQYPALVHCSISGYGQVGPHAERAAHDINYQADAGLLEAMKSPQVPGLLIADITAAFHATIAILAALVARRGATLDVSLVEAARAWVPLVPPPILRGDFACYNVYETADRQHVALGALESKFWERFCGHVGHASGFRCNSPWIPSAPR